jgi:hypothetical protein
LTANTQTNPPAGNSKPDSQPVTAPQETKTSSSPPATQSDGVDEELARLDRRAEATDIATNQLVLTSVRSLSGKLNTPERRVQAAVIESMALSVVDSTKRCAPLLKAKPDIANVSVNTTTAFNTLLVGCPPG